MYNKDNFNHDVKIVIKLTILAFVSFILIKIIF